MFLNKYWRAFILLAICVLFYNCGGSGQNENIPTQTNMSTNTSGSLTSNSLAMTVGCTGASPNWTTSPDYMSVSSCISKARPGDTINVLNGEATWASTLELPFGIRLMGAGIGQTIITSSQTPIINYAPNMTYLNQNLALRISGFTFDMNNTGQGIHLHCAGNTQQTKIRIDHNRFTNANRVAGAIEGFDCRGVIDNNIIDDMIYYAPIRIGWGNGTGETNWTTEGEYTYGTANAMYVEDNILNIGVVMDDAAQGGQFVYRYNTINTYNPNSNSALFIMHGWHSNLYSARGMEIYGNQIGGDYYIRLASQRGGRAVIFGNNATTSKSYNIWNYSNDGCSIEPYKMEQRINNSYYWNNRKNFTGELANAELLIDTCNNPTLTEGVNWWDDTNSNGVRCGNEGAMPTTCSVGQAYWATSQSCSDLSGLVGKNPLKQISGTLYKCIETDKWEKYYTPYTYPHPLRKE